jgi:hypothetical protein
MWIAKSEYDESGPSIVHRYFVFLQSYLCDGACNLLNLATCSSSGSDPDPNRNFFVTRAGSASERLRSVRLHDACAERAPTAETAGRRSGRRGLRWQLQQRQHLHGRCLAVDAESAGCAGWNGYRSFDWAAHCMAAAGDCKSQLDVEAACAHVQTTAFGLASWFRGMRA